MATQRISKGQTAILSLPRTQPFHFLKLPAEVSYRSLLQLRGV